MLSVIIAGLLLLLISRTLEKTEEHDISSVIGRFLLLLGYDVSRQYCSEITNLARIE